MNVRTVLSLALVMLSLIGILDAGYLTYEKYAGVVPPCVSGFECATVLNSRWAHVGPIALSAFGLAYYATVFILASSNFIGVSFEKINLVKKFTPLQMLVLLTTIGFFFSLYLVGLMAFVIKAWCTYCLISAAVSTALFVTTRLLQKTSPTATLN